LEDSGGSRFYLTNKTFRLLTELEPRLTLPPWDGFWPRLTSKRPMNPAPLWRSSLMCGHSPRQRAPTPPVQLLPESLSVSPLGVFLSVI
jgi:hypothetical protein